MNKVGRPKKINPGEIRFGEELDTREKQMAAVALLVSGRSSEFWKAITQILDLNIEVTETKILEDDNISPEERERFRMWRYYQIELRNLPDTLIEKYRPHENPEKVSEDPYD
jgi:hypothetical protein